MIIMSKKSRKMTFEQLESIFGIVCKWVGAVVLGIVLAVLLLIGIGKVEQFIEYPPLYSGTVAGFGYDDGHTTYSAWAFGNYRIERANVKDGESYWIRVVSGDHEDWWEVTQDQYCELNVGDFVSKW